MLLLHTRRCCDYGHLAPQFLVACFRSACQEPWLQVASLIRISTPANKMLDCIQVIPCHGGWVMSLSIASKHWSLRASWQTWTNPNANTIGLRSSEAASLWPKKRNYRGGHGGWHDTACHWWHLEIGSVFRRFRTSSFRRPAKRHRFEFGTVQTLGFPQVSSSHCSTHAACMFPFRRRTNAS